MAWALGILILVLMVAFSIYQLTRSNDASMRVDAWRSRQDTARKDPD